MTYQQTSQEINAHRLQIAELRQKMRDLQGSIEPEEVEDYAFETGDGTVHLSDLFGDKDTLFVVHNMGTGCPYCTLWADGFNGSAAHLKDRAAFVISSPDSPDVQEKFRASRNWAFRMVSCGGSSFAQDMGYKPEEGWMPGISVFRKRGSQIVRVSDANFGPGDDFCSVWQLYDLIPEGPDGWQPKYSY